jgi:predicted nucleic acid-binding protein
MNFVIDTNIVFSAILNPDSPIGQIILNGSKYFHFSSISQLKEEIDKHEDKILNISGLNKKDYYKIYGLIKSKIKFVNQLLINPDCYYQADKLTKGIDPDDILFVGLAMQLKCKLWTGDKKLIEGLQEKGFHQIISTDEMFQIYLEKELKRKK